MALNVTVGKFTLLAAVVGLVAFLTALEAAQNPLHSVTEAVVLVTLMTGVYAAFQQYRLTGNLPGPAVSGGTIISLIVTVLLGDAPQILSTPETWEGFLTLALLLLYGFEEELGLVPALGTLLPTTGATPPPATK